MVDNDLIAIRLMRRISYDFMTIERQSDQVIGTCRGLTPTVILSCSVRSETVPHTRFHRFTMFEIGLRGRPSRAAHVPL